MCSRVNCIFTVYFNNTNCTGLSKSVCAPDTVYSNSPHTIDGMKMAITEYIRNVDRAILNTVFENTVWPVNKCRLARDTLNTTCNLERILDRASL